MGQGLGGFVFDLAVGDEDFHVWSQSLLNALLSCEKYSPPPLSQTPNHPLSLRHIVSLRGSDQQG